MYTVIDKTTGQEIRAHNMFRVSAPFPGIELRENEKIVEIPEYLMPQIFDAYECVINAPGLTATAITITKTMEQWQEENPPAPQPPTDAEKIAQLEQQLATTQEAIDYLLLNQLPQI